MLNIKSKSVFSNQYGATLVIALVILLVMTIIGVSSMKGSTLQERMAGNARQKALAKNAAISAMRQAEIWMQINVQSPQKINEFKDESRGLYASVSPPGEARFPVPADFDVTDPSDWASKGVELDDLTSGLVSRNPKYIIEYLGRDMRGAANNPVQMLDAEAKADANLSPYFFRITAIGWGKDPNIYSIIESTFMTGYGTGSFTY